MRIVDVEQRSPEWFEARLLTPTASQFGNILTPTGKAPTASKVENYRNTLLAEWLAGGEVESYQSQWMTRGIDLEGQAREAFTFLTDLEVREVGFCVNDEPHPIGCSPDGLIGDDGGLEIKCPAPHTHVKYLLDQKLPTEYVPQVQGSMLVTGADYWYFMSFHPRMDPLLIKVERDGEYIALLSEALASFVERLEAGKQALLKQGHQPMEAAA